MGPVILVPGDLPVLAFSYSWSEGMSTSASAIIPELPPPVNHPVPEDPPLEPAACTGQDCCEQCATPIMRGDRDADGIPDLLDAGPRDVARGVRLEARAAVAAVMAPPVAQNGGLAAGAPFRINPAYGRLRTAIGPPRASKFDVLPSFYYNSASLGATEYGNGWTGTFRRKVTEIDSTTADLTTETGVVLHYTNKDAGGQYDAPGRAANGLKKNGDGTWTETCPDGFLYQFDSSGNLSKMQNYRGSTWTLTRDGGGRVTSCKDPFNRLTTMVYDGSNKINKLIDSAGRITTFTVTGGDLVKVTTPELCESNFTYDASHRMTARVNPAGKRTSVSYDGSDRVTVIKHPDGGIQTYTYLAGDVTKFTDARSKIWTIQYDGSGNPTCQIDPLGNRTTVTWGTDRCLRVDTPAGCTTFTYATMTYEAAQLRSVANPGGQCVTFVYSSNRVVAMMDALGKIVTQVFDGSGNRTAVVDPLGNRTTMTYNTEGQVTSIENPLNKRTTFSYSGTTGTLTSVENALNRLTTYGYNTAGRITSIKNALGNVTTFTRDNMNRVISQTNPLGQVTSYTYDTGCRLQTVKDPLGNVATFLYTDGGLLQTQINALSKRTTFTYDLMGNQTAVTNPLGKITTSVYNDCGLLQATINALNNCTTYSYDGAGRQIAVQDALGNITTAVYDATGRIKATVNALDKRTTFTYDANGRQISVENPLNQRSTTVYDDAGRTIAQVNALNKRTTFSYDAASRQRAVVNPLGHITTTNYDAVGRVQSVQNAEGNLTTNTYDAAGRLLSIENALNKRTTHSYDAAGRMTSITDANNKIKTLSYDAAGRITKETDPLGRVTTLSYDAIGQRTLKVDARNIRTTYSYDDAGRPTVFDYTNDASVTITYDAVGNETKIEDGTGTTTLTYDVVNRLSSATGPTGKTITYSYDAAGQRSKLLATDAGTFTYSYDAAGRLSYLINPEGDRTTYTYDGASRVTRKQLANTTIATFIYDDADRLTGLRNETTGGTIISRYTYTYDKVANRLSQDEGSGNVVTWTYDKTYRLTRDVRIGTNSYDTTYTYDAVGNRTVKIASGARTTYAYDAANQLTTSIDSSGTTTFTYDAAGNLTVTLTPTNQRTTSTWNDENRQTRLHLPSGAVTTYTYRWDGLRHSKVTSTTTKKFVFDGQTYLLETDASNVLQAVCTNEPEQYGNLVSQRIKLAPTTWAPVYYHFDALGSTRQVTNNAGAVANTYIYNAWGESVSASEGIFNRFRWVGQLGYYHDDESDDYYVRARYYDLSTGRWLSQDPLNFPAVSRRGQARWNRSSMFEYAMSMPVISIDPSGLQVTMDDVKACIAGVLAAATGVGAVAAIPCVAPYFVQLWATGELGEWNNDKWAHCVATCRASKLCCSPPALLGAITKELFDCIFPGDADPEDIDADAAGAECAGLMGWVPLYVGALLGELCGAPACDECCDKKYSRYK
jgi:RHS repeat-associated protein